MTVNYLDLTNSHFFDEVTTAGGVEKGALDESNFPIGSVLVHLAVVEVGTEMALRNFLD
jgi:hypothetical protein